MHRTSSPGKPEPSHRSRVLEQTSDVTPSPATPEEAALNFITSDDANSAVVFPLIGGPGKPEPAVEIPRGATRADPPSRSSIRKTLMASRHQRLAISSAFLRQMSLARQNHPRHLVKEKRCIWQGPSSAFDGRCFHPSSFRRPVNSSELEATCHCHSSEVSNGSSVCLSEERRLRLTEPARWKTPELSITSIVPASQNHLTDIKSRHLPL